MKRIISFFRNKAFALSFGFGNVCFGNFVALCVIDLSERASVIYLTIAGTSAAFLSFVFWMIHMKGKTHDKANAR